MAKTHSPKTRSQSRLVVYAALAGNLLIAVTKFVAAMMTGSSSMLTEGVHSLVDTSNEVLLLYGMRRARQPADDLHPFGYGREIYFWSFVVALLIFTGGAGISILEGVLHWRHPEPIDRPLVNFVVLGLAFVFEGISWSLALREFRRKKGHLGWWEALIRSKDPSTMVVLCEDSAALAGIVIAIGAIAAAVATGDPRYDGLGSILIGILLGAVAILLGRETKGLLIGERASAELVDSIRQIAASIPGIYRVNEVLTVHMAPDQVIGIMNIDFDDDLDTGGIEQRIRRIEDEVRATHSDVRGLFVRPRSSTVPLE